MRNQNDISKNSAERCSKCGGEKDAEGWCAKYCMDEDEENDEEAENECEACGEDHETRECSMGFCGNCYEILDNCDCEEPYEIDAEQWLKEKNKINEAYGADMEALKAEAEALEAEASAFHVDPLRALPQETIDVQVELLAFPYEVKERTVRIPKNEWDTATSTLQQLDLVFHYGQNDFQPSKICYSVSVNDVIRMPDGERFRVDPVGFTKAD